MNDLFDVGALQVKLEALQRREFVAPPGEVALSSVDMLRPPDDISTHEFAVKHRFIKGMGGAKVRFNEDLTPYIREVHDETDNPLRRGVAVKGPARCGKTLGFENHVAKIGAFGPSQQVLWYMHSQEDVQRYVYERVLWMIENHPDIRRNWNPQGPNKWNMKEIMGALWEWLAANKSTTRGRSAAIIVGDEVDAMRPEIRDALLTLIQNRQREYGNQALALLASHPDAGPEFGIDAILRDTDRRVRIWTCPDCAHLMSPCIEIGKSRVVRWNVQQLMNEQPDMPMDELHDYVGENVRLVCPNSECRAHIDNDTRLELDRQAVWMPRGQSIDEHENIVGDPEWFAMAGFVIHAFMAPFVSLDGLAREWLEGWNEQQRTGSDRKIKEVYVKSLGETYIEGDDAAQPREMAEIKARLTVPGQKLGIVPSWVRFLTQFIDIQGSSFEVVVIGWNEYKQSALIDRYSIKQQEGLKDIDPAQRLEDWAVLERAALNQMYPVEGTDLYLPIAKTGVDTGGLPGVTDNARSWCAAMVNRDKNPLPLWRLLLSKGDAHTKGDLHGHPRKIDKDPAGREYEVPIYERTINVYELKNLIARRMMVDTPGPLYMSLPDDLDEKYIRELVTETRVAGEWIKTGGRRNETWDGYVVCEVCRALLAPEHQDIDWVNARPFWATPRSLSPNEESGDTQPPVDDFFARLSRINK